MTSHHPNLSEDEYYVASSEIPTDLQIKTEVTEEEIVVDAAAAKSTK